MSRKSLILVLISITLFFVAYRDLIVSDMLVFGDLLPFPADPKEAYNAFFYVWQSRYMGVHEPQTLSTLFIAVWTELFGGQSVLAQKVYYFSLIPLAGIFFYYFMSKTVDTIALAKWPAALAYAVNPFTLGQFLGGSPGILLFYGVVPLLVLLLFKIVECPRLRQTVLFALVFSLASAFMPHGPIILLPLVTVVYVVHLVVDRRPISHNLSILIMLTLAYLVCFLVVNSWWFYVFRSASHIAEALPIPNLIDTVRATYSEANTLTLLTLGKSDSALTNLLRISLSLIAFSSLLFVGDRRRLHFTLQLWSIAFVFGIFIWLTHEGYTIPLFQRLPVLFVFRNPVKLAMFLPFAYSGMLAVAADGLSKLAKRVAAKVHGNRLWALCAREASLIIAMTVSFSVIGSNPAFLSGDLGLSRARPDGYTLPPVYGEAMEWIKLTSSTSDSFRILWLPYDPNTELSLVWSNPYAAIVPSGATSYGISTPGFEYWRDVMTFLCEDSEKTLGSLLAPLNVKYLVVNLSSSQKGECRFDGVFLKGSAADITEIIDRQKDLELVYQGNKFLIYENKAFIPKITGMNIFSLNRSLVP
ncbi:MAG: hypothetical protein DDT19_01559 [Syntrophomonadaceae bacterium]|nr:hypothetical protein [Bacillota bacterium]